MFSSVTMFGKSMNWNSGATYALTIIGIVFLTVILLALLLKLFMLVNTKTAKATAKSDVETVSVVEKTTYVEKTEKAEKKKPEKVETVDRSEPILVSRDTVTAASVDPIVQQQDKIIVVQQQPQVVYVQQPSPIVVPAQTPAVVSGKAKEDFDDFEDDEDFIEEESYEGGTVRYNKSFTAKYIQSADETKDFYVHLKNKILGYKKVSARMSWKRESFNYGRNPVARLVYRGKTLCICLPLNPSQFTESKYHVEDVSEITMYADTPCMYRIRNERRLNYAYELLAMVAKQLKLSEANRAYEDYYLPYEGLVQLIDKGLVKRVIRRKASDFIDGQGKN